MANDCHAEDGKFCEGGGSGSGNSRPSVGIKRVQGTGVDKRGNPRMEWRTADDKPLPPHLDGLTIPPAWTDTQVNPDPQGSLLVTGHDAAGRLQYVYSKEYMSTQKAEKFARISALDREFDQIKAQNGALIDQSEEAAALALVMETGVRPGSDRDTRAKVQAYGATTLEGRHVVQTPEGVRLQFVGKKGVNIDIPVDSPEIASMLVTRAEEAGLNDKIFDTSASAVLQHSHSLGSGSFRTKDFRTLVGTSKAKAIVNTMPTPTSKTAFKKQVSSVAKQVSAKLGNTPSMALKAYIAPEVFDAWRSAVFTNMAGGEPLFDFDIMIGTACPLRERPVGIEVRDEIDPLGDDEDGPCPPDVLLALGFDPDELNEDDYANRVGAGCGCVGDACFFSNSEAMPSGHRAIIQALDRWIEYPRPYGPQRFFYGADDFRGSEQSWEDVPVIFAQTHPDHRLVANNLEAALRSVTAHDGGPGRVVGRMRRPLIPDGGQPRLEADVEFDDPYVEAQHANRALALSSAFSANHNDDGRLTERVRPNHLLVFVQDPKNQPRDLGTMFLNKEDDDVTDEEKPVDDKSVEEQETKQPADGALKALIADLLTRLDAVFKSANEVSRASNDPKDPAAQQAAQSGPPKGKEEAKVNKTQSESQEARQSILQTAVTKAFAKPYEGNVMGIEAWIQSTFADRLVYRGLDGRLFEVPYVIADDNAVTLGTPVEVEVNYTLRAANANDCHGDDGKFCGADGGGSKGAMSRGASERRDAIDKKAADRATFKEDSPKNVAIAAMADTPQGRLGIGEDGIDAWLSKFEGATNIEEGSYSDIDITVEDQKMTLEPVWSEDKQTIVDYNVLKLNPTSQAALWEKYKSRTAPIGAKVTPPKKDPLGREARHAFYQKSNMSGDDASRNARGSDSEEANMATEMDKLKSELDAANQMVTAKTQELEAANKRLEVFEQGQRDAAWANMRDSHIPKGWLAGSDEAAKANKETDLRKQFEADTVGFMNKILSELKGKPSDKSSVEGAQFGNRGAPDDAVAATRELRELTGRR
jgi:DNA topoisomerase-1